MFLSRKLTPDSDTNKCQKEDKEENAADDVSTAPKNRIVTS